MRLESVIGKCARGVFPWARKMLIAVMHILPGTKKNRRVLVPELQDEVDFLIAFYKQSCRTIQT